MRASSSYLSLSSLASPITSRKSVGSPHPTHPTSGGGGAPKTPPNAINLSKIRTRSGKNVFCTIGLSLENELGPSKQSIGNNSITIHDSITSSSVNSKKTDGGGGGGCR